MKNVFLSLALLSALAAQAQPQPTPYRFTLEQAVAYAVDHNLNIQRSQVDLQIIASQIKEVKGRALPQVQASGRFTDNFSLAEQQLPAEFFGGEPGTTIGVTFGNRYSLSGGLEVQQQLLDFQLFSSLKSVQALEELQHLYALQTTEDLIINVVQVYIQVQISDKQIELLQQNYDRSDNLVKLSQLKLQEGIIKKLDLNQLLVNRTNLLTQLEDARYTKNEQVRLLKLYLNLPIEADLELTEKLEDRARFPLQNELTLETNLQYREMEKQQELALVEEKLVKAQYLPTISAFFNYNYLGNTNRFKFSGDQYAQQWNGTWGLSLSLPLFDGFQRKRQLHQKELATEKLAYDLKLLTTNIEKQYADAVEQITLNRVQIANQEENMKLANDNYEGIKLSYNEGVAPLTELLDAEFALRQAQSNYLNALLQYRVSELRVLKASGQLSKIIIEN